MSGASISGDGFHGDPETSQVVVELVPDLSPVTLVLMRPLRNGELAKLLSYLQKQAGGQLAEKVVATTSENAVVVRTFSWCDAAKFCLSVGVVGDEEDSGIRCFLTVQDRRCPLCGAVFEEASCRPDQWRDWRLSLDYMLSCPNCKARKPRCDFLDPLSPLRLYTE